MFNLKKVKFYIFILLISTLKQTFSSNVNQVISNNSENNSADEIFEANQPATKKTKMRSKFKQQYKPKTQEEIANQEGTADIAKTMQPLTVLCMNQLVNNNLIDDITEQNIQAHDMLPLLRTIQGIKKAGYKNKKIVKQLIKLTLDSNYKLNLYVLHKHLNEAAFLADENAVALLIKKGALEKKIYNSISEVVVHELRNCSLISYGDKYIIRNAALEKALIRATSKNQSEIVKLLTDNLEFDSNDRYNIVNQCLANAKSIEMASLYLTKGAELNVGYGPNDANCLGNAVIEGNIELIDFLLKKGASPIIANESFAEAITPVTYALEKMEKGEPLSKEILLKFAHRAPKNLLIQIVINDRIPEEIIFEAASLVLATNQIDINEQDKGDATALVYASDRLLYDIVKLLLDHGANVSLKDEDNCTALDLVKIKFQNKLPDWFVFATEEQAQENFRENELISNIIALLEEKELLAMID